MPSKKLHIEQRLIVLSDFYIGLLFADCYTYARVALQNNHMGNKN
jgi:hypothetical protein